MFTFCVKEDISSHAFSYISNMSERGFKVDRKANPFSIFISYLPRNFVSLDTSRGKGKRVGEWTNH